MQVQRALAAVALLQPEKLTETIATLYHMLFVERREIHTLELLGPVFSKILGERPAKVSTLFEIITSNLSIHCSCDIFFGTRSTPKQFFGLKDYTLRLNPWCEAIAV